MGINKEIISLILAGGKGTRLGVLTERYAKPAVPYGGECRLIDFPLSNSINSGINNIGVIVQHKPIGIYRHIISSETWSLKKNKKINIDFLPPSKENDIHNEYTGTANAIYQNLKYIEKFNPKYVLILSGDHIYKMDYNKMLESHKKNNADITISAIKVQMKEASRFGIINVREDNSIYEFEEKPKKPKSDKASMGIYIFNYDIIKKYLIEDERNELSSHDFGKDIIPKMLNGNRRLFCYEFKGYWKDVGTIESLWQANMNLLNKENNLNLHDEFWKIYSTNKFKYNKSKVDITGTIKHSIISENCIIEGYVENCVLFPNVHIKEGAIVKNSVILTNTKVESNSVINKAIIGGDTIINNNIKVGDGINLIAIGPERNIEKDVV